MTHLFVTNDFPPKIGGIQTMLWELWRRLDPASFVVLTTPHPDAAAWDAEQAFRVVRTREKVLLPTPGLTRRIDALAAEIGADTVVLDPALPVGLVGPRLRNAPYGVVLHGAEVTVPGRLPGSSRLLRRVLRGAGLVVAAGGYPLAEAERAAGRPLPSVLVPPGVDSDRFVPLTATERVAVRARLGLPTEGRLVVSVSRLVPRKGMDVLIRAAALLAPSRPDLAVAIAGGGRDHDRLERLIRTTGAPVRLLGRVTHEDLPGLYGCGDVFAMLCRNRWHGLEQEGFGIVFVEAAATGVPQVAGDSGGAAEAVADGETGLVVRRPEDPVAVADALARILDDPAARERMGPAGRARAVESFSYDVLAGRLGAALAAWEAAPVAELHEDPIPGAGLVNLTFVGTGVLVGTSVAGAVAPDTFGLAHAVLSCVLFVVGTGGFLWAYALGVSRSRVALVSIPGLFFLTGSTAPVQVRRPFRVALGVEIVAVVLAASIRPYTEVAFGILAPMFAMGLMGAWGGRHGASPSVR